MKEENLYDFPLSGQSQSEREQSGNWEEDGEKMIPHGTQKSARKND